MPLVEDVVEGSDMEKARLLFQVILNGRSSSTYKTPRKVELYLQFTEESSPGRV